MATVESILRRRMAAATDDRTRAGCAVALLLASIPAASSPVPDSHRGQGSGGEAGGSDCPAREFFSFDSPAGRVAGRVKVNLKLS